MCCHHLSLHIIWIIAMSSRTLANISETLGFAAVNRSVTAGLPLGRRGFVSLSCQQEAHRVVPLILLLPHSMAKKVAQV